MALATDTGFLLSVPQVDKSHLKEALNHKQIAHFRQSILVRDNHTCKFCGFHSQKFMDSAPKDGNPYHLSNENMVTACTFCNLSLNTGAIGGNEKGLIIFLPQLSQAELNWLVHACALSQKNGGRLSTVSTALYGELESLALKADSIWGEGISSPTSLTGVFYSLSTQHYKVRNQLFYGLRFLPNIDLFENEIDYWFETSYEKMNRHQIAKIYQKWLSN